jgi:hypothetical protein
MDRSELTELHYITAISNVPSMIELGLLSHERAAKVPHASVAMEAIQGRRSPKKVPGGRPLHEYVNLYINGRNVMLSKVLYSRSIDEVCVVRVSTDVIDLRHVVIADQNAASDYVRFADASVGLALVNRDTAFAQYWTHPEDQIAEWRHKSAMCAEVLVPDRVDPGHINGAYVGTRQAEQNVRAVAAGLAVTLNEYMFFK